MKKRLGELIMSCLFIVLGAASIVIIQMQSSSSINNTGATTFKSFPTLYGILIIIFAGINALSIVSKDIKEKRASGGKAADMEEITDEEKKSKRLNRLRTAGMFVLTVVFALLLKKVNFAILCFAFLFLSFLLLGRKKLWLNLLVAAVGSAMVYLIFVVLLKLPL